MDGHNFYAHTYEPQIELCMKNKKDDNRQSSDKQNEKEPQNDQFLERGNKGHDNHNMGNDISGEIKIANDTRNMEGGSDKTWHMDEGKEE